MEQLKATVNEERLERHLERFGMVFGFDGARYYLTDAPGVDPMHARVTFNTDDYGAARCRENPCYNVRMRHIIENPRQPN